MSQLSNAKWKQMQGDREGERKGESIGIVFLKCSHVNL